MEIVSFIRKKRKSTISKRSRKCIKRVMSVLLVVSLVLPAVNFAGVREVVAAEESYEYGAFSYTILEDGTVLITGYNDSDLQEEVVIPDTVDGRKVTGIGSGAFYGCSSLKSITIPNGVTFIGSGVFFGCTSLVSIEIPETVTKLNGSTFWNCTSLSRIDIPEKITSIGVNEFFGCSNLIEVNLSDEIRQIKDGAFEGCSSLTNINLPERLRVIGSSAFLDCSSLTTINLSHWVGKIGDFAFSGCSSLTSINMTNTLKCSIGNGTFKDCTNLSSIEISEGVDSIGVSAFSGCTNLTSIDIPQSVTSISDSAFLYCVSLSDVYYGGTEEGWNQISISEDNDSLINANIHYAKIATPSPVPTATPTVKPTATPTATPTAQPTATPTMSTKATPTAVPSPVPEPTSNPSNISGRITLDKSNFWEELLEVITFGIFKALKTEVTIESYLENSEIYYFVDTSGKTEAYSAEELTFDSFEWEYYSGAFKLDGKKNVVYARIIDEDGGLHYLCSNGIVVASSVVKPTEAPTDEPVLEPTEEPTLEPIEDPSPAPTEMPTLEPTAKPTEVPTATPSQTPTEKPNPTEDPYNGYINLEVNKEVQVSSDEGLYQFSINKQGKVVLKVSPDDGNSFSGVLTIYEEDENGNEVEITSMGSMYLTSKECESTPVRLQAGKYIIKYLYYYVGNTQTNLTIAYTEEDSGSYETEPNNDWNKANQIELNKEYTGNIQNYSDMDIYKFELKQEGSVYLNFFNVKAKQNWKIELYSEDKEKNRILIETGSNHSVKNTLFTKYRLPKGIYYIKCSLDGLNNYDDYKIKVNYVAETIESSEIEYNDTLDTANTIEVNKSYRGNIPTEKDVDYYSFSIDQASEVSVQMERENGETDKLYKVTLYRRNEDNKLIMYDRFYTGTNTISKGSKVTAAQGTYVIKVENGAKSPEDKNDYILCVKQSATTDNVSEPTTPGDLTGENGLPIMVNCKCLISTDEGRYIFSIPEEGNVIFKAESEDEHNNNFGGTITIYKVNEYGNELAMAYITRDGVDYVNEYFPTDSDDDSDEEYTEVKALRLQAGRYIIKYTKEGYYSEQVNFTIQYTKLSELPTPTPVPTPVPTVEPTPIPQPVDVITSTPVPVVTEKPNYAVKLKSKLIILKRGKSKTIKYTVTKGYKGKVKFKSSNSKIAKVTSRGKVTGRKKGKCKITVSLSNGNKAVVMVRVK